MSLMIARFTRVAAVRVNHLFEKHLPFITHERHIEWASTEDKALQMPLESVMLVTNQRKSETGAL